MGSGVDSLLHAIDKRMREEGDVPVPQMRLTIQLESEHMAQFLDYIRSRLRIARTTSLNLVLIMCCAAALAWSPKCPPGIRGRILPPVLSVGLLLLVLSIFAWFRIFSTYDKRLRQAYEIVLKRRPVK